MEPYATTYQLEARWRPLDPGDETTSAAQLLLDAKFLIDRVAPVEGELSEEQAYARMLVSVNMVKRAMQVPLDLLGVESYSDTTGPFAEQRKFSNPMADLYLTKADRELLGIGNRQRVTTRPFGSVVSDDPYPWLAGLPIVEA